MSVPHWDGACTCALILVKGLAKRKQLGVHKLSMGPNSFNKNNIINNMGCNLQVADIFFACQVYNTHLTLLVN